MPGIIACFRKYTSGSHHPLRLSAALGLLALSIGLATPSLAQDPEAVIGAIPIVNGEPGQTIAVAIEVNSPSQSIHLVHFSLMFDTARLAFVSAAAGPSIESRIANGATFASDTSQVSGGLFGATVQIPTSSLGLESQRVHPIVTIYFQVLAGIGETPLLFTDSPVQRRIDGPTSTLPSNFVGGSVQILSPGTGRLIDADPVTVPIGSVATLALDLQSQGNENTVSFTVVLDVSRLQFQNAVLGSDAAGATLTLTLNQLLAEGRVGIRVALPPNQAFAAGRREILRMTFQTLTPRGTGETTILFADSPVLREILRTDGFQLEPTFGSPTITMETADGLEADVAPRPGGNGFVSLADWVQIGRFAAALDTPQIGPEFQKADCAPLATLGNGFVTLADWVQAGRYAAQLEPARAAGGPDRPEASVASPPSTSSAPAMNERLEDPLPRTIPSRSRRLLLTAQPHRSSNERKVGVRLGGIGQENAVAFSLSFDPHLLQFINVEKSASALDAVIHINDQDAAAGRLGIVLALPPGRSFPAGEHEILMLRFTSTAARRLHRLPINFGPAPVANEIIDLDAEEVPAVFAVEAIATLRKKM